MPFWLYIIAQNAGILLNSFSPLLGLVLSNDEQVKFHDPWDRESCDMTWSYCENALFSLKTSRFFCSSPGQRPNNLSC